MARPMKPDEYAQLQREAKLAHTQIKKQYEAQLDRARKELERRLAEEAEKQRAEEAREAWKAKVKASYLPKVGDRRKNPADMTTEIYDGYEWTKIRPQDIVVGGGGSGWFIGHGEAVTMSTAQPSLKATVHKAGHFPIDWMMEAFEAAEKSEKLITIQLEKDGVTVIGTEGEAYETYTLPWTMMEKAEVNPIPLAIETVEKHLNTLHRLKKRVNR